MNDVETDQPRYTRPLEERPRRHHRQCPLDVILSVRLHHSCPSRRTLCRPTSLDIEPRSGATRIRRKGNHILEVLGDQLEVLGDQGPGVDTKKSPTVPGGQSGSVTVALQKGSYELWCSVDSHKDKGMDLTITVG